MPFRAIRGATTIEVDDAEHITAATVEMVAEVLERNELRPADVISILFTATADVTAMPPAAAARTLGITDAALMCAQEMHYDGGVEKCIRMMLHADVMAGRAPRHVYLHGATVLRPDLAS